jgi:hypothetical protein
LRSSVTVRPEIDLRALGDVAVLLERIPGDADAEPGLEFETVLLRHLRVEDDAWRLGFLALAEDGGEEILVGDLHLVRLRRDAIPKRQLARSSAPVAAGEDAVIVRPRVLRRERASMLVAVRAVDLDFHRFSDLCGCRHVVPSFGC